MSSETHGAQIQVSAPLPRVTIQFCTQCKWMLRAAYFAQELLSTFSLSLGEVALQSSTGGTFIVTIHHHQQDPQPSSATSTTTPTLFSKVLWDRKIDGGFPETKELKRRVRDVIEPGRDLGHVDRYHRTADKEKGNEEQQQQQQSVTIETKEQSASEADKDKCQDCS